MFEDKYKDCFDNISAPEDTLDKVYNRLGKPRGKRVALTLLIAAVLVSLMTATAFAAGIFSMRAEGVKDGDKFTVTYLYTDESGEVAEKQKAYSPTTGIVLNFTSPGEIDSNGPEFKANWLPCEPDVKSSQNNDGWYSFLSNQMTTDDIPYIISSAQVYQDYSQIISGNASIVKEEDWDNWHIIEITEENLPYYEEGSYVIMFDAELGWVVIVCGYSDMETIVKIAENLEVRECAEPIYREKMVDGLTGLSIGRG